MILDKEIEIKITKRNLEHYSIFFDNISLKDIIKIDPSIHLQNGSNIKLNVSCDICYNKRNIKYQAYYKNINSSKYHPIYTCDKCSHIKIKSNNIDKYGVDHYSKTDEYREKIIKTNQERYGVDHYSKTDEYKERYSKTCLEKFGVENPFMDNKMIRDKFKEKYGVDHPSKVKSIYEKIEKGNLLKTGYKSPLSSPKIRKIFKKRYGVNSPNELDIFRKTLINNNLNYIKYEGGNISSFNCESGHIFFIDSVNYHNRTRLNIPLCTVCNPVGDSQSIKEKELLKFISSIYNGCIKSSYRDGLEIDIYLPDLKLGFEFNGIYWHSEEYKDRNYHLNKTKHFKNKGIRIIHIWEDDWLYNRSIIESMITNILSNNNRKIFARKCVVKIVNVKDSSLFINNNHIQGKSKSSLKLGLYHENELVSIMTFDHFEGRNKMCDDNWNLNRFCNLQNTNVVGGASKLLNHFIKNYNVKRIISYADKDWSVGGLYYKLGFDNVKESSPDYKYILDGKRVNKSRFRKSRLDTDLSESDYMKKSHIKKIWDCGKIKFELLIK